MERPLTEWELDVLTVLASVGVPGADLVRECVPHLVATDARESTGRGFALRDTRHEPAPADDGLRPFSNAWTADGAHRYSLVVDADGRPHHVGDPSPSDEPGPRPDPGSLIAAPEGLSPRWRWFAAAAVLAAGGCVLAWSLLNGYGPDTAGEDTCAVHASIVETDDERRQWFFDHCVDAVPGGRAP